MKTFAEILTDARVMLNDSAAGEGEVLRYTDPQLLVYARQAVMEARRIRPDLFLTQFTTDFSTLALTDAAPLPDEYVAPVTDFVVMRAEMRDDEFAVDGRAAALVQRFRAGFLGVT